MKLFVWQRSAAIAKKEVFHIIRDPFTLASALALPVFMVMMFGLAIEFNTRNIPLAVSDSDQSQSSRRLVDTFSSSHYFLVHPIASPSEASKEVTAEKARAALIIPPNFEKDLFSGRGAAVQVLVDGSDNSTVGPVFGYLARIQRIASQRIAEFDPPVPYQLRTRFLFNPELNSRWFIVPGLCVMIMAILSVLLTALTVAREYELGSMELLLSTPVRPLEIMIGKLAPYGALGAISMIVIYIISRTVFGVPFVGNLGVFAVGGLLFLIGSLAQGLLISVGTRKQMVAMQLSMITAMLPSQLLSGFIFPIESMPKALQYLTMLLPARWFMEIARDTYLKGSGLLDLWGPFLGLTLFSVIIITMGARSFKRNLEP